MKTEHPALHLLTDLIENINDDITESNQKNVTEEMNVELLMLLIMMSKVLNNGVKCPLLVMNYIMN